MILHQCYIKVMEEEAKMLDVSKVLSLIEKIKKNADELKSVSDSYGVL